MRKTRVGILLAALGLAVAAGAGYGWHRWREQRMAAVMRAALPPIPNLAGWPREYASRVRAATAAAQRLQQPYAALCELAALYHANLCYREAEQIERRLHELEPANARWSYYLADACGKLGDTDGQRAFLELTLKLAPYYPTTRIKLADLLLKLGLPDEARAQYEWRLMAVPNDAHGRLGLARLALQRGDRAAALKQLEAIAQDHPDFASAHNLLSEIYSEMGDTARADEQRRLSGSTGEWREADDPWFATLFASSFDSFRLEMRGGNSQQTPQLKATLPFYEKAVRLAPADGSAYDALGNVYVQLNRLDEAAAALEAGLTAAPRTAALYSSLAQVHRKQGHPDRAIAVLRRGLLALPAVADLPYDLGTILEADGRRPEAAAAYRAAADLNPGFSQAFWSLGLCQLALRQEAEARTNLGRALALRPSQADALTALAQQALDAGDLGKAACCLRTLTESAPGTPTRQLAERGLAAARQKGDPKSVAAFEQLLTQPLP